MGRKNNRIQEQNDKKFSKFVSNFMAEQKEKNRRDDLSQNYEKTFNDSYIIERNKSRLEYVISQLELNDIKYTILNESLTLLECYRKSDNYAIRFYASNGHIVRHPDFRGVKSLINLLLQKI